MKMFTILAGHDDIMASNNAGGGGGGSSRLKQFFSKRDSPILGSTSNSRRSSIDIPPHLNNLLSGMFIVCYLLLIARQSYFQLHGRIIILQKHGCISVSVEKLLIEEKSSFTFFSL